MFLPHNIPRCVKSCWTVDTILPACSITILSLTDTSHWWPRREEVINSLKHREMCAERSNLNTHCCGGGQGEKQALCIETRHLCLLLFSVCIPSSHSSISLTSSHGSREKNGGPPASSPLFLKVRSRHTSFE